MTYFPDRDFLSVGICREKLKAVVRFADVDVRNYEVKARKGVFLIAECFRNVWSWRRLDDCNCLAGLIANLNC